MPNYLAVNDWKKLIKDFKDVRVPEIGAQLEAFAKAEGKKDLLEQISALHELLDEAKAAKAKHAKNKDLASYLELMVKEANKSIGLLESQAAKQAKEKEKEEEEEDEQEKDDSQAANPELLNMLKRLKMAKSDAPLRFAVVMKSAMAGAVALSKKKVTPDQIKEAKEGAGGGRIVARGVCFTEDGGTIFETPKDVAASIGKAVKFFVFRDTGKKIKPVFRVREDLEVESEESEDQDATGGADTADGSADWTSRRQAIEPTYLETVKKLPDKSSMELLQPIWLPMGANSSSTRAENCRSTATRALALA